MKVILLALLVLAIVPAVPTADAYACLLDPENPEGYVNCEVSRATRCLSRLLSGGTIACPL